MKYTILLALAASALLSSCKKETPTYTCRCTDEDGNYPVQIPLKTTAGRNYAQTVCNDYESESSGAYNKKKCDLLD